MVRKRRLRSGPSSRHPTVWVDSKLSSHCPPCPRLALERPAPEYNPFTARRSLTQRRSVLGQPQDCVCISDGICRNQPATGRLYLAVHRPPDGSTRIAMGPLSSDYRASRGSHCRWPAQPGVVPAIVVTINQPLAAFVGSAAAMASFGSTVSTLKMVRRAVPARGSSALRERLVGSQVLPIM